MDEKKPGKPHFRKMGVATLAKADMTGESTIPAGSVDITPLDAAVNPKISNITGQTFFSPNEPIPPLAQAQAQGAVARRFDYRTGYNIAITPRHDSVVGFSTLRAFADPEMGGYDLLRILLENKKDLLCSAEWTIIPDPTLPDEQKEKLKNDDRIAELIDFFKMPDGEHMWRQWLRALAEDMLVIDAVTLRPRLKRNGKLAGLDLMDGATIEPVIDVSGRTPRAPDVAYRQIIKGVPASNYSTETLIYFPRNIRTNRVYGFSPVEQIITTVNIALRRQLYQLQYYTEGSAPDTLFAVPEGWTADQIIEFEENFNAMLSGNTAVRRQAKFVPKDTKLLNTREKQLGDEYDEWLARICCFALSTSPQPFIKMMNRATAETMKETADEEGAKPWLNAISDLMNMIIWTRFGWKDLCWSFKPIAEVDPVKRSQADGEDVKNGIKSVDEVRIERAMKPIGMGPAIVTQQGPIMLEPFIKGEVTGVPTLDAPEPQQPDPSSASVSATPQDDPTPSKKPAAKAPKGGKAKPKAGAGAANANDTKKFVEFAEKLGISVNKVV